ncbi:L-threonylcarbamoyladenylate synthase [Aquabacterium sp. A7-Y]|uniref:L-threonylcarbamoyladenylate synthase n=1 Tax=Aquabacterium sp. A7-Y TaxID=1349605 RepID=UPI00223D1146|nr:L-threonylcarbamoyladenylate synthase [Aquabacterium sp. A7-Y]MCW7538198.1 L-threonylcarbamoyladenylate synthase [Aquabacterium sp. A7-Y]
MQATEFMAVAEAIARGGVALLPTDTNYALACDPWDEKACARLYEIKKRPPEKPLTLFVAGPDDAIPYTSLSGHELERFQKLARSFWPGPLNLIVPASPRAPKHRYFDRDSISIVCNANASLQAVLKACGHPLALTSANLSGVQVEGLITPQQAVELFGSQVDAIAPPAPAEPQTTRSSTIVRLGAQGLDVVRQGDLVIA